MAVTWQLQHDMLYINMTGPSWRVYVCHKVQCRLSVIKEQQHQAQREREGERERERERASHGKATSSHATTSSNRVLHDPATNSPPTTRNNRVFS
jgi:hypothetical protein